MRLTRDEMERHFYAWVYDPNIPDREKFDMEKIGRLYYFPSNQLMNKWHNNISVAQFGMYMHALGCDYGDAKDVAKQIIAKKKMQELLDI